MEVLDLSEDMPPGDGGQPYITRVHMENFMCHTNFAMELNPRVNLICGANGSGKSTVLTAIMVVLGGSARSTNRGTAIDSLIKSGKASAYVHVTLRVPERFHSLYAKFGNEVTVTRKIRKTGGGYEVRGSDGRIVRGEGSRTVKDICQQFRLYPDNELAMLSQETAKEFLVHAPPRKKYDKLAKALRQDELTGLQQRTLGHASTQRELITQMHLRVGEIDDMLQRSQNVLKAASLRRERTRKLKSIYALIGWRELQEVEARKNDVDEQVSTINRELAALHTESIPTEELKTLRARLAELTSQRSTATSQIETARNGLQDAQAEHAECESLVRRIDEDLADFEVRHKDLRKEIEKTERDEELHSPERLEERRQALERKQAELRRAGFDLEQQKYEAETELEAAKVDLSTARDALKSLHTERDKLEQQRRQFVASLRDLQNPRAERHVHNDSRSKHERLRKAVDSISAWDKVPIGPLYKYVKVSDEGSEYVPALESQWSRVLESWWVQSPQDRTRLQQLASRMNFSVNVMLRKDDPFDFTEGQPAPSSEYQRVVDVLAGSSESFVRILVDITRVEKLVLANIKDANAIARKYNVRDVLAIGVSKYGNTNFQLITNYGPRQDTSYVDPSNRGLLKIGNEAQRRLLQRDISNCDAELRALDKQIADQMPAYQAARDRCDEAQASVTHFDNENAAVAQEIDSITTEVSRIDMDYSEQDFAGDLRRLRRALQAVELHSKEARETRIELVEDVSSSSIAVSKAQQSLESLQTWARDLRREIDGIERKLHWYDRQEAERNRRTLTKAQALLTVEAQARTNSVEYDEAVTRYREEHGEPQTREEMQTSNEYFESSTRALSDEIEQLTSQERVFNANQEDIDRAEQDLERAEREREKIMSVIRDMERGLEYTEEGQDERTQNSRWHWQTTKDQIQEHFQEVLGLRGYTGVLSIEDKKRALIASAAREAEITGHSQRQVARETATLSGGEKSLTQIALLVAVWQTMHPGLVAMDEYDVFMDKVNRSTSLRCIGETVEKMKMQCIIITPQDVDTSALEGIEHFVRRLAPAR